ncbi:endoplasmic reticulum membrane sensor NFE2L1a [Triplophysa rosa]|uniref:Endoplasmic reticulum membrane sensor NFE2L1 n=1 Tax=Triplophysa rosa TaxID=992332 RepID=A0A9W7TTX7_TRIRA|nr:endoplasmic reticulum membrane sensor NFE2L1a [Triplophysa rosa]KAI7803300.1 Nfe2l1 protein [Triplophysa rosa]
MLDLKKYFTDGLIQVAILLSLAGMRVDVDPYLPPLGRILVGPSSAVTQTQFHNLRNMVDEYHLHPKSVDLDGFFTARRLLSWVRSLDHLQVPVAELEAWLVYTEPDNGVSIPSQMGFLEDGGLEDVEDPSELSMRLGGGELGYDVGEDDTFGAVGHMSRSLTHPDQDEVIKEEGDGMSVLWEQEHHQDQVESAGTQPLQLFNEEEEDFMMDGWRNANPFHDQMFEENAQLSGVREDTSLSIEECLRLIDTNLLSGEDTELPGPDAQNVEEHALQFQRPLISPLLPEQNSTFSLEQQWQDVLAIMESQDMDTTETIDNSHHNISESNRNIGSVENFVHQDVSLHQATLPRSSEGLDTNSIAMEETRCINNPSVENTSFEMSSNVNCLFEDSDIVDLLLTPGINSSGSSNYLPCSLFDQQNLSFSHLDPLLEEAMLNETGLMDLASGEFNQAQIPQFEEHKQADSDSGLSLDYSQSPSSPSGSESSSSSSSCPSSPSSPLPNLIPEEGAVGFTHIKEEEEEGAIGGFMLEETKMSHTCFLEAKQFHNLPWLEHVGHDHTYNQPRTSVQKKSPKHFFDDPLMKLEQLSNRDEKRARALNIPFPNEFIINLPVEEFNQLLSKNHLTGTQLTLIREIRRRGKNKMAAQNCRRRKLDVLVGLEQSVDGLRRRRTRLLRENAEVCRSVREMKQRLNTLYQEVCERMREEQGSLCSDYGFGLEEDDNGPVGLVSRRSDSHSRRKLSKRRKEKK